MVLTALIVKTQAVGEPARILAEQLAAIAREEAAARRREAAARQAAIAWQPKGFFG